MQLDILAICAHPDDIELSCGGTVAKCVKFGYKVGIIDLTEGELGTRGNRLIRRQEAVAAAKVLGIHVRENLKLPDGNIELSMENRLALIKVFRKYRPRTLLIPHSHERHPDHVHAHHLAKEAWFYAGLAKIKTRLAKRTQEPWRPGHYLHFMQRYEFTPSFIVDVSDVFDIRMKAIRCFKSQFFDAQSQEPETLLSQKSFLELIETRAKYFGQQIGAAYGEPFYSTEPIGIADLAAIKLFRG